ncbi:MAG TPA: hypothetical protein PK674_02020 [Candidatus Absconditabacterales bacterium]|nr:hypothetical protein [Candidatus Absconditabacterales bacterium]HOQ79141.1 hypothetical protein [Candidatus Absconditabacterales bacterium]HPK28067.1 hypothetical protein [Candidatus Absconditabacterales bacterium]
MNNKLRQGLIISTIVILGLLGQVKEAIAQTLNDKNIDKTEELARITDNTASAINMNFDLDRSSPDASAVKQFFMGGDILTEEEKVEFDMLWNKAMQSNVRDFYEKQILKFFNGKGYTDEQKKIFVSAFLDQTQTTKLGQYAFKEISQNRVYQFRLSQIIKQVELEVDIAKLDREIIEERIKGKELDQKGKELDQKGKELDVLLDALKNMEEAFKQYQTNNK